MNIQLASGSLMAILLFLASGMAFALAGLGFSRLVGRKRMRGIEAESAYECGEEAVGSPWVPMQPHYYTIALAFLLFEVEAAFLFPWAAAAYQSIETGGLHPGLHALAFASGFTFVVILAIGLAYLWARGFLDWPATLQRKSKWKLPISRETYLAQKEPATQPSL